MKIAVVGCGYVGLVTGGCLANLGNDVICVDIDDEKVDNLRKGQIPFFEPGLRDIVELNLAQRRLMFTTDMELAVQNSDVIFLAVGTPSTETGEANLSYIFSASEQIGKFMNSYKTVVIKSTVPAGTFEKVREIIKKSQKKPVGFDIVSNPEFLREGEAVNDFMVPDRVVIGVDSEKSKDIMFAIYKSIERTGRPILVTDIISSELIKVASNAMLATRISFMNELSRLCEKVGADVKLIAKGMGLDSRIGPRFLQAGLGYGGSCFPKDVKALAHTMKQHGVKSKILDAVNTVNDEQRLYVVEKIRTMLSSIKGKKIAIWGLSFKPKTDDMREAPSITLINELQNLGAEIVAFDPVSENTANKILKKITYAETPLSALEGAHALVLVTEWDLFRELDKSRMKELMASPNIIDGRNIYDPAEMKKLGFNYTGVGR
ncbi:UDP-glucose/GDP-mannose dehydrogenase family protein [Candidatus Woesearchaeota archaeon]|nr:UDP-glucose/GDP-mannose dehydrogenase family protein [Candidatus Woesearchaeota archaeon]